MHITFDQVKSAVASWAADIKRSDKKYDYIIGVSRGGLVPATMLSYATGIPMRTIEIKTRDKAGNQVRPTTNYSDDVSDIMYQTENNILFVEDIIDSGLTLSVIDSIMKYRNTEYDYATVVYNSVLKSKSPTFYYTMIDRDYYKDWIIFPWDDWK